MKQKISILIIIFGTIVEWYDFAIFSYLAPYISKVFLPKETHSVMALIYTYGIFGLGFLTRPLGGFFFGTLGDKYGRKNALTISGAVMLLAMLIIILLPGYAYFGIFSIVFLLLSRLLQGFAVGGEYVGSIISTMELSEDIQKKRRGFFTSLPVLISNIGFYLGLFAVSVLQLFFSNEQILHFGFRIPFVIGGILALIFIIVRPMMVDSNIYMETKKQYKQKSVPIFFHKKNILITILLTILSLSMGLLYYGIYISVPQFLTQFFGYKETWMINLFWIIGFLFIILSGIIADKVNVKTFYISASIIIGVIIFPLIYLIFHGYYTVGLSILFVLHHIIVIPFLLILTQAFKSNNRFLGTGIAFNMGNALTGFAPMLFLLIYHYTQQVLSIGIVLAFLFILNAVLVLPLNKKIYASNITLKDVEKA